MFPLIIEVTYSLKHICAKTNDITLFRDSSVEETIGTNFILYEPLLLTLF